MPTVDAHTAHHLYHECLKGELMRGRTIILVSHHVQLCAPGAKYIASLDNGLLQYSGDYDNFQRSEVFKNLVQQGVPDNAETKEAATKEAKDEATVEKIAALEDLDSLKPAVAVDRDDAESLTESGTTIVKKPPRKLVEDEKRAVGHIDKEIWTTYIRACGGYGYWLLFALALGFAAITPVLENGWLKCVCAQSGNFARD